MVDVASLRAAVEKIKSGQREVSKLLSVDDDAEHIQAAVGYLNFALDSLKQYLEGVAAVADSGTGEHSESSKKGNR